MQNQELMATQPEKTHTDGENNKRKPEGGSEAADMSFDNESVQNDKANKSQNSQDGGSGDESNRSFANNDDEFGEEQQHQDERDRAQRAA